MTVRFKTVPVGIPINPDTGLKQGVELPTCIKVPGRNPHQSRHGTETQSASAQCRRLSRGVGIPINPDTGLKRFSLCLSAQGFHHVGIPINPDTGLKPHNDTLIVYLTRVIVQ